jgi:DnaJ-class molecular chaperone
MNLVEACKILEVSVYVSKEDLNKSYRELAFKYHPDVSKEENASDKFKRLTEAYELVIKELICDGFGHIKPIDITEVECPYCDGEGITEAVSPPFNLKAKCFNCLGVGKVEFKIYPL